MLNFEPMDRFSTEFPKLSELHETLSGRQAFQGWFTDLPNKIFRSPFSHACYRRLEDDLQALDSRAWEAVRQKLVQQSASTRRELISLLNEAAGYVELHRILKEREIEFSEIRQPQPSGTKGKSSRAPEWVALQGDRTVAAIEVKTAFESDEQQEFRESNTQKLMSGQLPRVKRLLPAVSEGLLNKLSSHVQKAKSQLTSPDGEIELQVIYLIVEVDHEPAQLPECEQILQDHIRSLSTDKLIIIGDFRGLFYRAS